MSAKSISIILFLAVFSSLVFSTTQLSSCAYIGASGTYVLTTDITNSSETACMNITANNVVFDCQGHIIDGIDGGSTYGIYAYRSSNEVTNITIKNCNVSDWDDGIHFERADNNTFINNTVISNKNYAFEIYRSSNNTLINNTVRNNGWSGIEFYHSSYNTIKGNAALNNSNEGFYIEGDGYESTLINNTAINNSNNGFYLSECDNVTFINNTANYNTRGVYLSGTDDGEFINNTANYNDFSGFHFDWAYYNVFINNTANYNKYGIYLAGYNTNLTNNTAKENDYFDFFLDNSGECNNKIVNMTVSNNMQLLYYNSSVNIEDQQVSELILCNGDYSTIDNVTVNSSQTKDNNGVLIYYTNYTNVTNCNLSNNYGLYLDHSLNNTFTNNTISSSNYGFYLKYASNNTITDNSISGSDQYGIYLYSGGNNGANTFYNNFFNNTNNFYFHGDVYQNYWNTTEQTGQRIYRAGNKIGGNFWAKPDGTGYSETCSDQDKDGICNNAYTLNSNGPNIDYLPLSNGCLYYYSQGNWTSPVKDFGSVKILWYIQTTSSTPEGTSIQTYFRAGNVSTPDSSWTDWTQVTNSQQIGIETRYFQILVNLSTADELVTPSVSRIRVVYS